MMERAEMKEFRVSPKSWGAEFVREGEVRFRLWAPGLDEVLLRLDGVDAPMGEIGAGWFEMLATGVAPGARYAFVLPDGRPVPDPASRAQAGDVHGPSEVVDATAYRWQQTGWRGRAWEEAVIHELHVGTFTPEGTFRAAARRLGHLAGLGVTAVELMPVAQFSGSRGWGYDGVLLYAPHSAYGSPEEMKAFVDAAHGHGLMVLLDVVYNHFGPDGNYLHSFAPDFFHPERNTPWGPAIAYEKEPVRRFFVENALYWIEEFNLDGLRLDAIDQIEDELSKTHILVEIAERVRADHPHRQIHLTTEDNRNVTYLHERDSQGRPTLYTAEWNDDFHNAAHATATGESEGYYADFAEASGRKLARALAEGFAWQGEVSKYSGRARGAPSSHLPPTSFIDFIQNHDQVGNRAFGDRLNSLTDRQTVEALTTMLLLSPHIPLMFMGDEFGETRPFNFFTDFHGELADAVREGRRNEFSGFASFQGTDPANIPDPHAVVTFEASKLDWTKAETEEGRQWLAFTGMLLEVRRRYIVPLLHEMKNHVGRVLPSGDELIAVDWKAGTQLLQMRANLGAEASEAPQIRGEFIHAQPLGADAIFASDRRLTPGGVLVAIGPEEG